MLWHERFRDLVVHTIDAEIVRSRGEGWWQEVKAAEYVCPNCGAKYDDPDPTGLNLSGFAVDWLPEADHPGYFVLWCCCGGISPERDWYKGA